MKFVANDGVFFEKVEECLEHDMMLGDKKEREEYLKSLKKEKDELNIEKRKSEEALKNIEESLKKIYEKAEKLYDYEKSNNLEVTVLPPMEGLIK